jgi:hypothetical protein
VATEKGSFHSRKAWLEKLEKWMTMHSMKITGELPSAGYVASAN